MCRRRATPAPSAAPSGPNGCGAPSLPACPAVEVDAVGGRQTRSTLARSLHECAVVVWGGNRNGGSRWCNYDGCQVRRFLCFFCSAVKAAWSPTHIAGLLLNFFARIHHRSRSYGVSIAIGFFIPLTPSQYTGTQPRPLPSSAINEQLGVREHDCSFFMSCPKVGTGWHNSSTRR